MEMLIKFSFTLTTWGSLDGKDDAVNIACVPEPALPSLFLVASFELLQPQFLPVLPVEFQGPENVPSSLAQLQGSALSCASQTLSWAQCFYQRDLQRHPDLKECCYVLSSQSRIFKNLTLLGRLPS